jgi:hypothetical protein
MNGPAFSDVAGDLLRDFSGVFIRDVWIYAPHSRNMEFELGLRRANHFKIFFECRPGDAIGEERTQLRIRESEAVRQPFDGILKKGQKVVPGLGSVFHGIGPMELPLAHHKEVTIPLRCPKSSRRACAPRRRPTTISESIRPSTIGVPRQVIGQLRPVMPPSGPWVASPRVMGWTTPAPSIGVR